MSQPSRPRARGVARRRRRDVPIEPIQTLEDRQLLAPVLAVLSGMGFASLGATIWGWFYVYGAAFFGLAVLMAFCAPYGLSLLGIGWFVCLVSGAIHLNATR